MSHSDPGVDEAGGAGAQKVPLWVARLRRLAVVGRSWWFRLLLSALLLFLVFRSVKLDWAELQKTLQRAELLLLVLPFVFKLAAVLMTAIRMATLFRLNGYPLSTMHLFRLLMFGELINKIIPGSVGAIAYLTYKVGRPFDTVVLLLLDKALFFLCVLLIGSVSALVLGDRLLVLAGLVLLAAAVLAPIVIYLLTSRWQRLAEGWQLANKTARAISIGPAAQYLSAVLAVALLMSASLWVLFVAVDTRPPLSQIVAAVMFTTVAVAIPLTINGVGIREWLFLRLFDPRVVTPTVLFFSLVVLYLVGLLSAVLGLLIWLFGRRTDIRDAGR